MTSETAMAALRAHQDLIARETLATDLSIAALSESSEQTPRRTEVEPLETGWSGEVDLGAPGPVMIALCRAR